MSVINKMLQELDQRQAASTPGGPAVRPMRGGGGAAKKGREAFWRLMAFLMLACVAWVAVLAFQLQVQPLVTNLAFKAADDARSRPVTPPPAIPPAPPASAVPIAEPGPVIPIAPPALFKLAPSIQMPIPAERARKPAGTETAATALGPRPQSVEASKAAPLREPYKPLAVPADAPRSSGKVEKLERPRTPQDQAEAGFRRAVVLLNEGRNGDAQEALSAAIAIDKDHEAARQALASLLLEQSRIEPARKLLQDGIAINPGNTLFASSLARILVESKEYDRALGVLKGAGASGAASVEFQALVGAIQQRLGRHREAMESYQAAVRLSPSSGSSWMGLGVSLEALGHRPEAAEAFRRAIATGSLTAELHGFAETRLRQIQ